MNRSPYGFPMAPCSNCAKPSILAATGSPGLCFGCLRLSALERAIIACALALQEKHG